MGPSYAIVLSLLCVAPDAFSVSPPEVRIFELFETGLSTDTQHSNPFNVEVNVSIQGPASSRRPAMAVAAFYDGDGTWKFRFAPDVVGYWNWTSAASDAQLDGLAGHVACVDGPSRGALRVDEANPSHFVFEDGSRHLMVGYEADWLWALGLEGDTSSGPDLDALVGQAVELGMNHFVLNIFSNFSGWNDWMPPRSPPKVAPTLTTPWLGDARDRLNLDFFRHYDKVLRTLDAHGATAHVMFYVGNKNVLWPKENSTDDDLYWRYAMARFAAFPNIVLDVSKEASHYGVGVGFIASRLRLMRALNAHGRIVTAHAGQWGDSDCPEADACDMISRQSHFEDPRDFYQDLLDTRKRTQAPVLNIEFLYEAGPVRGCAGAPNFTYPLCGAKQPGHCFASGGTPDTLCVDFDVLRFTLWDLYMAGGYATWYYGDTAWDVISTATPSAGHRDVGRLVSFWNKLSWWRMQPSDELLVKHSAASTTHCLSENEKQYVVYSYGRSSFSLDLSGESGGKLRCQWYSPASGTFTECEAVEIGAVVEFSPPDADELPGPDVALLLDQPLEKLLSV